MLSSAGVFVVAYCTGKFIINISLAKGKSMEPAIQENDIVISIPYYKPLITIKHSNIIIAKCPLDTSKLICKRVLYLEDDVAPHGKVPKNNIWIEGDNKLKSYDSRSYGPVPHSLIKSIVVGKIRCNTLGKLINAFK